MLKKFLHICMFSFFKVLKQFFLKFKFNFAISNLFAQTKSGYKNILSKNGIFNKLNFLMISGGKLSLIIQGMDQPTLADPETMKDRRTLVVNYFTGHLRTHNSYVFKFVFCEVLNLVNILTQVTFVVVEVKYS